MQSQVTLPSSGSQGDTVQIIDYGTADTNNIMGETHIRYKVLLIDLTSIAERAAFSLVYVDVSQGWLLDSK